MLALTGAIPALVVMWIFDRADAKRPEPRWTLRKVALAGALAVIPVAFLQIAIGFHNDGSYERAAFNGFFLAGFIEELAKMLCVYLVVWRKPEFDERMDGITYAARAGLGFALVENVLYLWQALGTADFATIWVLRAVLAVPGHAIWAGIMGYFVARRRFDQRGPGLVGGLLIAAALHGAYDAPLFAQPSLRADLGPVSIVLVLGIPTLIIAGGAIVLRRLARRAVADDDRTHATPAKATLLPTKPGATETKTAKPTTTTTAKTTTTTTAKEAD